MFADLEDLKAAMLRASVAPLDIVIINDPTAGLERYRRDDLDQSHTCEVGPTEFPGGEWYAEYQKADRAGDDDYAEDLLRRGAATIRRPP
jgi:hypothetical protein